MTQSKTIPMRTAEARAIIAGLGGLWGAAVSAVLVQVGPGDPILGAIVPAAIGAALSCGGFAPLFGRAGWRGGVISALGGLWVTFLGVATGVTLLLLVSAAPIAAFGGAFGVSALVMVMIATHPLLGGVWILGAVTLHAAARWLRRRPSQV